ncbi:MAG TPA: type II toxin-antitoxin system RelE/ParE family toxin [Spongiibacteraceae bacterium]|jgi:mRNA interferase RelE/StbE
MESYKLVFKKSIAKDLRSLAKQDVAKILERFDELRINPRPPGCEKLSGQERYRLRQGTYRIIYEIADKTLIVCVVKVGHRREVYR